MDRILKIESISQFHNYIGYEKAKHPLISIIDYSKIKPSIQTNNLKISTSFYSISFKDGNNCATKYRGNSYDFQEGILAFIAPEQDIYVDEEVSDVAASSGWNLCFHRDFLSGSALDTKIDEFSFFSYNSDEALYLSDQEKQILIHINQEINHELNQNLDEFSKDLLLSYLELFLNYCKRFYGRQFITRSKVNKEIVYKFEATLRFYFNSAQLEINGLPTVKYLSKEMGYSANYLSDLLKKETGKNAQEHIHHYLIQIAKSKLRGTNKAVNIIAGELGFEYPQHFSKLFKSKTGVSPKKFRDDISQAGK